jgi:hypothetical protein
MRVLVYIVLGLIILGVLAFAVLVFLSSGGFDRWAAERDVAARGVEAAEPVTATGYKALKIPRGWRRDTYIQYLQDNFGGVPRDGGGPETVFMSSDNDAQIDFALGGYSHIGGRVTMSRIVLYARATAAPDWTPTEDPVDNGMRAWVRLGAEGPHAWYMRQGNLEDDRGYELLTVDVAKRLRLELRTTKDLYARNQAIQLSRSVLASAEVDIAAVDAARAARLAKDKATDDAAAATLAVLGGVLTRDAPLAQGLNVIGEGSFILVEGRNTEVRMRLAEVALTGRSVEDAQKALALSDEQIASATGRTGDSLRPLLNATEIYAVWICEGRICARNIRAGADGQMRIDPNMDEMSEAMSAAIPKDRLFVYRFGRLYLPDQTHTLNWFKDTKKLKALY